MNDSPKNWKTLLNRWISGEANRHDERSLEGLAQDDPFLADALEGYRSMPEADHARSLVRVNARLRKRSEQKRSGAFYLLRVAAVGAFLLGAWWVFQQLNPSENKAAAFDMKTEVDAARQPAHDDPSESPISVDEIEKPKIEPDEIATNAKESAATESRKKAESSQNKRTKVLDQPLRFAPISETAGNVTPPPVLPEAPPPGGGAVADEEVIEDMAADPMPTANDAVSFMDVQSVDETTIHGRVTDSHGDPLIGASVLIEGTEQGAITDANGYFDLQSPMTEPGLSISYTGFETTAMQVVGNDFLNIELSEGVALEEVVVTSKKSKRAAKKKAKKDKEEVKSERQPAVPAGGFEAFKKYIEQKRQIPQIAIDANVNGSVLLSFQIDANGRPFDIRVLRSLGFGCDEEAIRLLKAGPDWEGSTKYVNTYEVWFE